jgi:hypothetical protein
MLNIELVETLYGGLSSASQEHIRYLLFGNKQQDLSAFFRSNDIGLSKLEILADYFRMPLESFRKDSQFDMTSIRGNNMVRNNIYVQEDESLAMEREALKKEIANLRNQINAKTAELEAKD